MTQSSGKQPKNKPPEIKTRQPQKRNSGGFFDNLRQPHPIEEILGLQQEDAGRQSPTPVVTPAVTPVRAPVDTAAQTPVTTPVFTPADSPVASPVPTAAPNFDLETESNDDQIADFLNTQSSPVATTVPGPVSTPVIQRNHTTQAGTMVPSPAATPAATPVIDPGSPVQQNRPFISLDATHSSSEQRVYSIMYRETIAKKIAERHFGTAELMKATGIRSDKTVRLAIDGLLQKKSVAMVRYDVGNRLGPRYRVFGPKEIFEMRARLGIEVDPQSKKIVYPDGTPVGTQVAAPAATPVITPVDRAESSLVNTGVSGPVTTDGVNYPSTPVEITGPYKYKKLSDADSDIQSSSASVRDDMNRVKVLFEQLANGGKWRDDRDNATYEQIADIPLWHIIMGLCYSVGRSPEHKMSSLAYAVPQIQEHYKQMQFFPDSEMLEIAYRNFRKTLLCISTGNWTVAEWER